MSLPRFGRLLVAGLLLGALGAAWGTAASAQTPPGFAQAPRFGAGGTAGVVFSGGTVAQLEAAALSAGADGVWVQDASGTFQLLVVGGPAFLTDGFRAKFAAGLGVTAVTLTRAEAAPPAAPTATIATPTPPTMPAAPPSSSGVIRTCIEGEFEGWEGDSLFELCNGDVVVQIDGRYTYRYAYRPNVTLIPSGTALEMIVEGVRGSIQVVRVPAMKTCIVGVFDGAEQNKPFTLCNGQIWQEFEYRYTYRYLYSPSVILYEHPSGGVRMKVAGVARPYRVVRLR